MSQNPAPAHNLPSSNVDISQAEAAFRERSLFTMPRRNDPAAMRKKVQGQKCTTASLGSESGDTKQLISPQQSFRRRSVPFAIGHPFKSKLETINEVEAQPSSSDHQIRRGRSQSPNMDQVKKEPFIQLPPTQMQAKQRDREQNVNTIHPNVHTMPTRPPTQPKQDNSPLGSNQRPTASNAQQTTPQPVDKITEIKGLTIPQAQRFIQNYFKAQESDGHNFVGLKQQPPTGATAKNVKPCAPKLEQKSESHPRAKIDEERVVPTLKAKHMVMDFLKNKHREGVITITKPIATVSAPSVATTQQSDPIALDLLRTPSDSKLPINIVEEKIQTLIKAQQQLECGFVIPTAPIHIIESRSNATLVTKTSASPKSLRSPKKSNQDHQPGSGPHSSSDPNLSSIRRQQRPEKPSKRAVNATKKSKTYPSELNESKTRVQPVKPVSPVRGKVSNYSQGQSHNMPKPVNMATVAKTESMAVNVVQSQPASSKAQNLPVAIKQLSTPKPTPARKFNFRMGANGNVYVKPDSGYLNPSRQIYEKTTQLLQRAARLNACTVAALKKGYQPEMVQQALLTETQYNWPETLVEDSYESDTGVYIEKCSTESTPRSCNVSTLKHSINCESTIHVKDCTENVSSNVRASADSYIQVAETPDHTCRDAQVFAVPNPVASNRVIAGPLPRTRDDINDVSTHIDYSESDSEQPNILLHSPAPSYHQVHTRDSGPQNHEHIHNQTPKQAQSPKQNDNPKSNTNNNRNQNRDQDRNQNQSRTRTQNHDLCQNQAQNQDQNQVQEQTQKKNESYSAEQPPKHSCEHDNKDVAKQKTHRPKMELDSNSSHHLKTKTLDYHNGHVAAMTTLASSPEWKHYFGGRELKFDKSLQLYQFLKKAAGVYNDLKMKKKYIKHKLSKVGPSSRGTKNASTSRSSVKYVKSSCHSSIKHLPRCLEDCDVHTKRILKGVNKIMVDPQCSICQADPFHTNFQQSCSHLSELVYKYCLHKLRKTLYRESVRESISRRHNIRCRKPKCRSEKAQPTNEKQWQQEDDQKQQQLQLQMQQPACADNRTLDDYQPLVKSNANNDIDRLKNHAIDEQLKLSWMQRAQLEKQLIEMVVNKVKNKTSKEQDRLKTLSVNNDSVKMVNNNCPKDVPMQPNQQKRLKVKYTDSNTSMSNKRDVKQYYPYEPYKLYESPGRNEPGRSRMHQFAMVLAGLICLVMTSMIFQFVFNLDSFVFMAYNSGRAINRMFNFWMSKTPIKPTPTWRDKLWSLVT